MRSSSKDTGISCTLYAGHKQSCGIMQTPSVHGRVVIQLSLENKDKISLDSHEEIDYICSYFRYTSVGYGNAYTPYYNKNKHRYN